MEEFLRQLKDAVDQGLYYISLISALVLIDICGALDSDDGRASPTAFVKWYEAYLGEKYTAPIPQCTFSGQDCYNFRCSMIHQGTTVKPKSRFTRIAFLGGNVRAHCTILKVNENSYYLLDVSEFVGDVLSAAQRFTDEKRDTDKYRRNYEKFVRLHPDGFPPIAKGIPVIT